MDTPKALTNFQYRVGACATTTLSELKEKAEHHPRVETTLG
jgi:hypothetical protein